MNQHENGGPAFPLPVHISQNNSTGETVQHQYLSDGMSLRDYFAAKAMQGLISSAAFHEVLYQQSPEAAAEFAYKAADSMLKARGQ